MTEIENVLQCILSVTSAREVFCLTVWLKNINPWRLQQNISVVQVLYICCTTFYILYYQAASYIIGQTSLMVRLRNIILWRFSAAMILKPCYGACLLLCIFVYITFYILNFLLFLISILILIQPSVHWPSALLARQAQITSQPYEARELWITHDCARS